MRRSTKLFNLGFSAAIGLAMTFVWANGDVAPIFSVGAGLGTFAMLAYLTWV